MLPNERYARLASEWWLRLNVRVFGSSLLRQPTIQVIESNSFLGRWIPESRTIQLSVTLVTQHDWLEVVEVLKHEMAHQYVFDVLGVEDETSHGPAFQMVCRRFAICHRAAGLSPVAAAKRKKIEALLALGESSNPHEAENALRKARELMQEAGLDHTMGAVEEVSFSARPIGPVRKRVEPHQHAAAGLLGEFFGVRCILIDTIDSRGHQGTQLEIIGTHSDLEVAEYVHHFALVEADRFWAAKGLSSKREERDFKEGFVVGLRNALRIQKEDAVQEPGLIPLHQDEALADFFKMRHPRTTSARGSRRQRGVMFGEGVEAGKNTKISKGVTDGKKPKLLGPRGQ